MKNPFISALCLMAALTWASCGSHGQHSHSAHNHGTETHQHSADCDHAHEADHGHNHEADETDHNHATHNHEAHVHEAAHTHAHEADHGHNHSAHNHGAEAHQHSADCDHAHEADHGHDHEADETDHNHAALNHGTHNHEAHAHAHEADHEPHAHEAAHPHPGEIHFTRAQARLAGLELYTVEEAPFQAAIPVSGRLLEAGGAAQTLVATQAGVVRVNPATWVLGAEVKAGQSLLSLSARDLSGGDPADQAALDYEAARKAYERAKVLVRDTLISPKDFEQIELAYEQAALRHKAQASRQSSGGIQIKAPFAGYVAACFVQPGDYVAEGTPLARITQTQSLHLELQVPLTRTTALKEASSARFRLPGSAQIYDLDALDGRLLAKGRGTEGNGAYRPVTFRFRNPGDLEPGTFVEAWLLSQASAPALAVPVGALTEEQGLHFVYVQVPGEDEAYLKREVSLGLTNGAFQQVLAGLQAGEKVVCRGVLQVRLAGASAVIPDGHNHNH